jgi:Protein of unknown function (DUF1569).
MQTLLNRRVRARVDERLALLRPESARRWGRMSAPQMICHLTDAFRGVMGERGGPTIAAPSPPFRQAIVKWIALFAPLPWPRGLRTAPAADQEEAGTPPSEFLQDRRALQLVITRFVDQLPDVSRRPHFLFGHLTPEEWARWGFRHIDHHLRQFGV